MKGEQQCHCQGGRFNSKHRANRGNVIMASCFLGNMVKPKVRALRNILGYYVGIGSVCGDCVIHLK